MSASNSGGGGGGGGRRPFFNDRRITVAGPQRLRQNVQDLLSQFNRQFVADNPQLLHELAEQLNRLQDLLSTNNNNAQAPTIPLNANNENNNIAAAAAAANNNAEVAGPRRIRHGIVRDSDPGPSSNNSRMMGVGDDLLTEFENNINRLAAAEIQSPAEDGRSDQAAEISTFDGSVVLNMDVMGGESIRHVQGPQGPTGVTNGQQQPQARQAATQAQQQQQQQGAAAAAAAAGNEANNPDADWHRLLATLRTPEMQRVTRMVLNFGPFVIMLIMKWMFTYAAGIVILLCLVMTFLYAESVIESSSRSQQGSKWRLLSTVMLIALNVGALYFFFSSDRLYLALIMQPTEPLLRENTGGVSFLELLWLVVTTDYVAKFIFMTAKCLLISGSTLITSNRRRKARTYQWLEYTSHLYRHWLPATPWSYYLAAGKSGGGYIHNGSCTVLFVAYVLLKVKLFRPKLTRWWQSTAALFRPTSLGQNPSTADLMSTGPTCSICYGEFANPVQLVCKHIFCEECVTTWLDKQKTCPMCRTEVVTGDNDWKDGKTSYCLQLA